MASQGNKLVVRVDRRKGKPSFKPRDSTSRHKLLTECEHGDFLFPVLLLVVSKPLNLLRIRGWEEKGNHTVQMNIQMRASEIISVIPVILAVERDSTICVVDGGAGERKWIMTSPSRPTLLHPTG